MKLFARQSTFSRNLQRLGMTLLTLPFLLPGCSRNEEAFFGRAIPVKPSQVLSSRPVNGRMFTIGVVLPQQDAYFRAIRTGLEGGAADNEVLLEAPFAGPKNAGLRRQARQLIARRVDALLIWPSGTSADADVVPLANNANIAVFTVAASRGRDVAANFVTSAPFASLPPQQIGKTAVDRIAAYLRGEKLSPQIVIRPETNHAGPVQSTDP